jgi:hypothetical protein
MVYFNKQLESKIARIETILDELQKDKWLSRRLMKYPGLVEKINVTRKAIEDTKAEAVTGIKRARKIKLL